MRPPKNPIHPGEILLEEFLRRGKRGVTADAALDLADALGTSSKIWMNLQATWDLDAARRRRQSAA